MSVAFRSDKVKLGGSMTVVIKRCLLSRLTMFFAHGPLEAQTTSPEGIASPNAPVRSLSVQLLELRTELSKLNPEAISRVHVAREMFASRRGAR